MKAVAVDSRSADLQHVRGRSGRVVALVIVFIQLYAPVGNESAFVSNATIAIITFIKRNLTRARSKRNADISYIRYLNACMLVVQCE